MAQTLTTTKSPVGLVDCGQCFIVEDLGRVRVLSVDFDTVRVRRVDEHGEALPRDYSTHVVPKADLEPDDQLHDVVDEDTPVTHVAIASSTLDLMKAIVGAPRILFLTVPSPDSYKAVEEAIVTLADLEWMDHTLLILTHRHLGTDAMYGIDATWADVRGAQAELISNP